jgi:hypothetical protein
MLKLYNESYMTENSMYKSGMNGHQSDCLGDQWPKLATWKSPWDFLSAKATTTAYTVNYLKSSVGFCLK